MTYVVPDLADALLELDILRSPHHDLLNDDLYSWFFAHARSGHAIAVVGGPNCRTWSRLRHRKGQPGPAPVRAATGTEVWGFRHIADREEATKCREDNILMIRLMASASAHLQLQAPLGYGDFEARLRAPHSCDGDISGTHPDISGYFTAGLSVVDRVRN
jgi:hypothetical protein